MKVFSYLDEADIPLEQSWAWVRSRQVLGEVISRSNGNFLTFQSTIGFSSTFHIHIHLQKSMVAWPCNPSLYFCEIGDDLIVMAWRWPQVRNQQLVSTAWKVRFSVSRTVEECEANWKTTKTRSVRTVSSRVTLTLYVGLVLRTYSSLLKVR